MLPIRDDNPTSRLAWVTLAIIALNAVAFLLWEPTFASGPQAPARQELFFFCHALIPWEVIHHTNLAQGGEAARQAIIQNIRANVANATTTTPDTVAMSEALVRFVETPRTSLTIKLTPRGKVPAMLLFQGLQADPIAALMQFQVETSTAL